MVKVILPVGVQGAGKSTVMKLLSRDLGIKYISADEYGLNRSRHLAAKHVKEGYDVIIDSTHVTRKERCSTISDISNECGISPKFIACVFNVPLKTALERNDSRKIARIPSAIIKWSYAQLLIEPPLIKEGFDRIVFVGDRSLRPEDEISIIRREIHGGYKLKG